ncbi:hypothetical protein DXG01_000613, partial [Tephrocybe rancida]
MVPLRLHWHQLAGISAVIRMLFFPDPTKSCGGALITDDVGLGKTFQAAGTIALLADIRERQQRHEALPPIIRTSFPTLLISRIYINDAAFQRLDRIWGNSKKFPT